jgi:hypothetical protein
MRNYLAILLIWGAAWYLPTLPEVGGFYDQNFHTFQASISIFLLLAVFSLTKDWWRKELGCILVLQILLNVGDAFADFPFSNYDSIQSILNWLELVIILGFGIPTLAYKRTYGDDRPDSARNHSDTGRSRSQERVRHNA